MEEEEGGGWGVKTFWEDLPIGLLYVALEIAAVYGFYTAVSQVIRAL